MKILERRGADSKFDTVQDPHSIISNEHSLQNYYLTIMKILSITFIVTSL